MIDYTLELTDVFIKSIFDEFLNEAINIDCERAILL